MLSPCDCGRASTRQRITYDEAGNPARCICPECTPGEFTEPFRDPSDNKIYSGPQAMPHLYKRGPDDVYRAKDELIADTTALWEKGPTARAIEQKQKARRSADSESLTADEIEKTKRWGEDVLAPILREQGIGGVIGALKTANERVGGKHVAIE